MNVCEGNYNVYSYVVFGVAMVTHWYSLESLCPWSARRSQLTLHRREDFTSALYLCLLAGYMGDVRCSPMKTQLVIIITN